MVFEITVIIPTHNPRRDYLSRTLEALAAQTLDRSRWELVVVDNKSEEPLNLFEGEKVQRSESVAGGESRVAGSSPSSISHLRSTLNVRVVREDRLGLTHARVRGFAEAKGEIVVMVDDDNVLRPDYLEKAVEILDKNPLLGAIGGKALPEYEIEPPEWLKGIRSGLGLRDLGSSEIVYPGVKEQGQVEGGRWKVEGSQRSEAGGQISEGREKKGEIGNGRMKRRMTEFPDCAPIGAGMVIRREAALEYVARIKEILGEAVAGLVGTEDGGQMPEVGRSPSTQGLGGRVAPVAGPSSLQTSPTREELRRVLDSKKKKGVVTDRKGKSLSSGGDNDICLTVLEHGWQVGYFPELELNHLIPKERMTVEYQCRMARDAMRSFIVMLDQHGIRPWPAMAKWTLPLRVVADWCRVMPWQGPERQLEFHGHIGMYRGRVNLNSTYNASSSKPSL